MNKLTLSTFSRKHLFKIIIICTSIAIFALAFWVRSNAEDALNIEKNLLQQQQSMNNTADESAVLLNQNLGKYKEFQQQGIIGNPQRLQWLESVQHGANQHLIPKLNFILSATEVTTDANPIYHNEELITKSTLMQMTFTLLHEGDFYHLLHNLQGHAQGVFNVEECEIRRNEDIGGTAASEKLEGQFVGRCDLRWYSMADITQAWEVSAP